MKLKILAQSKDYLVIHKPSGFVTYADSRQQEAISAKFHLEHQTKRKLFPVHRIDKDTCGVLAFAANPEAAKTLTALFKGRTVKKAYVAVVHGEAPLKGVINEPLARNKEKVTEPAETEFTRLGLVNVEWDGEARSYSLVRCDPRTGRYHQIRRHLAGLSLPLVGDQRHGDKKLNRLFREHTGKDGLLLRCVEMRFHHPRGGEPLRFRARWPGAWHAIFDRSGFCPLA